MLLMSHLQDTIHQSDVGTQILHNHTMVQVGLCAFREGIQRGTKLFTRYLWNWSGKRIVSSGFATPKIRVTTRTRQLPFHMHINLGVTFQTMSN